jgi:ATP-binding cassette subfamily B protein
VGQLSLALMFGTLTGDLGRGILDMQEMSKRLGAALAALGWQPAVAPGLSIGGAPVDWDILVSDLEFRYPNSLNGIKSSTIRIKKGEKIGLKGPSGAGKSTFLGLISGRYHPQRGEVRIGGVPTHQIPSELLVRGLTQVSQSAPVFHRSILENLTYGCPEVSRDRVWQTLEKVKLAEYVKRLPEGLDTLVGNSGQKLSGGERARLALARALYWDSQIILLDEATAALDLDTEEAIMTGLRSWLQDRTVICVSHRSSLLNEMDRILVVQDGRVAESAQGSSCESVLEARPT